MIQSLQTLAIFTFTAVSAAAFWFAYDSTADAPEEDNFPENTLEDPLQGKTDRYASLLSLDVGDPVVVRGPVAGERDRIVRPVAFADQRHLWVEGHKFRRYDGWQADIRGLEADPSWIEPEPS